MHEPLQRLFYSPNSYKICKGIATHFLLRVVAFVQIFAGSAFGFEGLRCSCVAALGAMRPARLLRLATDWSWAPAFETSLAFKGRPALLPCEYSPSRIGHRRKTRSSPAEYRENFGLFREAKLRPRQSGCFGSLLGTAWIHIASKSRQHAGAGKGIEAMSWQSYAKLTWSRAHRHFQRPEANVPSDTLLPPLGDTRERPAVHLPPPPHFASGFG